jgi:hypothetical protein
MWGLSRRVGLRAGLSRAIDDSARSRSELHHRKAARKGILLRLRNRQNVLHRSPQLLPARKVHLSGCGVSDNHLSSDPYHGARSSVVGGGVGVARSRKYYLSRQGQGALVWNSATSGK